VIGQLDELAVDRHLDLIATGTTRNPVTAASGTW
jgi:hypothetical protein